jgi:DNA-binding NarL/FixJ family response regulator
MVEGPRILLGRHDSILLVGLRRVLADEGIVVAGHEEEPERLVDRAAALQPDVVVLDLNDMAARDVADGVRRASPGSKVVLWARDETLLEVLDPGADAARVVVVAGPDTLRNELVARTKSQVE